MSKNGSETKPENVQSIQVKVSAWTGEDVGYVPVHVSPSLDQRQGQALKRIHTALDRQEALLANGRPVASFADAVRYVLEEFATKMGF